MSEPKQYPFMYLPSSTQFGYEYPYEKYIYDIESQQRVYDPVLESQFKLPYITTPSEYYTT